MRLSLKNACFVSRPAASNSALRSPNVYGVLRALIARAICGAGLHFSFGLHHHNRYDAFALADDLMEPFRPIVDEAVAEWVAEHGPAAPLDRAAKAALVSALLDRRFRWKDAERTLFDVAVRMAASVAGCLGGKRSKLLLPDA